MTAKNPVGITFFVCSPQNNDIRKKKKQLINENNFNTDVVTNQRVSPKVVPAKGCCEYCKDRK
jgi:hypothetical protein